MSDQDILLILLNKVEPRTIKEMRSDRVFRDATENVEEFRPALLQKAREDWQDKNLTFGKTKPLLAIEDKRKRDEFETPDQKGKGKGTQGLGTQNPRVRQATDSNDPNKKEYHQQMKASITCRHCLKRGHIEIN